MKPDMPNITQAQLVSAAIALVSVLTVVFKLNISDTDMAIIVGSIGTIVPVVWILADALLRGKRNVLEAARITAATPVQAPPPTINLTTTSPSAAAAFAAAGAPAPAPAPEPVAV